jgi:hypothetical protein
MIEWIKMYYSWEPGASVLPVALLGGVMDGVSGLKQL